MKHDNHLREEIRKAFDDARIRVRAFTGLYADEDLANQVLSICDDVLVRVGTSSRLNELRRDVVARCHHLTDATNRFSSRDPAVTATARMHAIVALDQMQDAALEHMILASSQGSHTVLRRRSL